MYARPLLPQISNRARWAVAYYRRMGWSLTPDLIIAAALDEIESKRPIPVDLDGVGRSVLYGALHHLGLSA